MMLAGLEVLDGVAASAVKVEDHRVPSEDADDSHKDARNQQIADDAQRGTSSPDRRQSHQRATPTTTNGAHSMNMRSEELEVAD